MLVKFKIQQESSIRFSLICNKLEISYITKLGTIKFGYNLLEGGSGGKPSEETKQKMREAHKRLGTQPPHTPESIAKMVKTKTGQKLNRNKGKWINKRSNPCIVNGFIYPSETAAAHYESIHLNTLRSWLRLQRTPKIDCSYLDEKLNIKALEDRANRTRKPKIPCEYLIEDKKHVNNNSHRSNLL